MLVPEKEGISPMDTSHDRVGRDRGCLAESDYRFTFGMRNVHRNIDIKEPSSMERIGNLDRQRIPGPWVAHISLPPWTKEPPFPRRSPSLPPFVPFPIITPPHRSFRVSIAVPQPPPWSPV